MVVKCYIGKCPGGSSVAFPFSSSSLEFSSLLIDLIRDGISPFLGGDKGNDKKNS